MIQENDGLVSLTKNIYRLSSVNGPWAVLPFSILDTPRSELLAFFVPDAFVSNC